MSKLSVWWLRLGVGVERIRPGHPEQNGQHERMHLTLKQRATKPAAANLLQQQGRFDAFVRESPALIVVFVMAILVIAAFVSGVGMVRAMIVAQTAASFRRVKHNGSEPGRSGKPAAVRLRRSSTSAEHTGGAAAPSYAPARLSAQ